MGSYKQTIADRILQLVTDDSFPLLLKLNPDYETLPSDQKQRDAARSSRRQFVSYLISVATHPIGLKASVPPYNCAQEYQLAYLMEVFEFSEAQLNRMTLAEGTPKSPRSPSMFRKRHSWRPELVIRLGSPVLKAREKKRAREFMRNMSVRVYLFGDDDVQRAKATFKADSTLKSSGNRVDLAETDRRAQQSLGFIESLKQATWMRAPDVERTTLIRPVNEMKLELKYVPTRISGGSGSHADDLGDTFKTIMVGTPRKGAEELTKDKKKSPSLSLSSAKRKQTIDTPTESLHLNVRRYYAESRRPYILRFEFWLNSEAAEVSWTRRVARRLVHSSVFWCSKRGNSPYMSEHKLLYGYINLKLDQIPSYATRRILPILSLRGQRLSCVEVCLEFRNRRLDRIQTEPRGMLATSSTDQTGCQFLEAILNHIRLYTSCLVFHLVLLKLEDLVNSRNQNSLANYSIGATLDNILYLPGHTLINQHRLQSNLRRIEDQSLRRSSMLSLLISLDESLQDSAAPDRPKLRLIQLLLISMLHHEYLMAHRLFDAKTEQETEVFGVPAQDKSHELVLDIEEAVLTKFFSKFLSHDRLRDDWLTANKRPTQANRAAARTTNRSSPSHMDQYLILESLRLARGVLEHYKTNKMVDSNQRHTILGLEPLLERSICDVIKHKLELRFKQLIQSTTLQAPSRPRKEPPSDIDPARNRHQAPNKHVSSPSSPTRTRESQLQNSEPNDDSWNQLAHFLERVDHDLRLHWAHGGLASLEINLANMLVNLDQLKRVIKARVDRYLAEEGPPPE